MHYIEKWRYSRSETSRCAARADEKPRADVCTSRKASRSRSVPWNRSIHAVLRSFLPPSRIGRQLLGPLQVSMSHRLRHLHHAPVLRPRNTHPTGQIRPCVHAGSSWTGHRVDLVAKGTPNAAWRRRPAVCQHEQRTQTQRSTTHLLQQPIGQLLVSAQADRSRKPQPRRPHHRHAHLASCDPDLIGVDMLHDRLMDLLALPACSILPRFDRSLIQRERLHHRLD